MVRNPFSLPNVFGLSVLQTANNHTDTLATNLKVTFGSNTGNNHVFLVTDSASYCSNSPMGTSSLADSQGNSFTLLSSQNIVLTDAGAVCSGSHNSYVNEIWEAKTSGTTPDKITVTWAGGTPTGNVGASAIETDQSTYSLETIKQSSSNTVCPTTCIIKVANFTAFSSTDIIVASFNALPNGGSANPTCESSYAQPCLLSATDNGAMYKNPATSASTSAQFSLGLNVYTSNEIVVDVALPTPTASNTITCKLLEAGATTETYTLSGGSVAPTTGSCTSAGASTSITANTGATVTITVQTDGANTRYRGNASWTAGTSYSFVIGSSITVYNYYQLQNTYKMTPKSPATWDNAYSKTATGTALGVGGSTIVTISLSNGGGAASASGWADYNLVVTLPTSFASTIAIAPWQAVTTNTFTSTTGGNTLNVNYSRFAGSNIIFVNWTGSSANFPITVNLVFQTSGSPVNLSNSILISYTANSTRQVVYGVNGANVFAADSKSIVTVNGISQLSGNNTRWCLSSCTPFSFNISIATTENVNYWEQVNVSWRWVPPLVCSTCSTERPQVTPQVFSAATPFSLSPSSGTTLPTPYTQSWADYGTSWTTSNPFFYNGKYWTPNSTGFALLAPRLITISYTTITPPPANCNSTNPFIDLISGCWVGTFYYTYSGALGNFGFGIMFAAIDVAIYLKTENPLTALLLMVAEGAVLGVFLPTFFLPLAAIFMTIGLAGSIWQIIRTR